jgi:hypothetical protein
MCKSTIKKYEKLISFQQKQLLLILSNDTINETTIRDNIKNFTVRNSNL